MDTDSLNICRTSRGFAVVLFRDHYGEECSLQESSLAEPAAIWFGCDRNAFHSGTGEPLSPRMHLTREQVAALLPLLAHFAETGKLPCP